MVDLIYRIATAQDIPQIQRVRQSVLENVLSDPGFITDELCEEYLVRRGKGWVAELHGEILGFAIVDLLEHSVWALFLRPESERKGIGKKLHKLMLDWYFQHSEETLWLSTEPRTRAETFYRRQGWTEAGKNGKEIRFEMSSHFWQTR